MEWEKMVERLTALLNNGKHSELRGALMMLNEVDIAHFMESLDKEKLLLCAKQLDRHLDRTMYPRMYCDYFWGTTFKDGTASMGAQTSGASLIEGVARLEKAQ